jgi:hypothetical protein
MPLDLTLSPLYRINGQEISSLPGLLALAPPRNAARGREHDRLIVYLLLTGNAVFSTSEYMQIAQDAANIFFQTAGALTSALRAAAEGVNKILLERNMAKSVQGQYALGWLTLAALRETQCTLALSGPMHAYWFGQNETRHIHEPVVSGKGLGINQTVNVHYAQTALSAGERLLFFGRAPSAWDSALNDPTASSLDAMRRRLVTLTNADLNAVLMQAMEGAGVLNLLNGDKKEETAAPTPTLQPVQEALSAPPLDAPAHILQSSTYAPAPQPEKRSETNPSATLRAPRDFPSSIPRTTPPTQPVISEANFPALDVKKNNEPISAPPPKEPREPSERTRQAAKIIATGIQAMRQSSAKLGEKVKIFLPRVLPNAEVSESIASPSSTIMMFTAVLIPLMVVTIASVIYLRYGRSQQYEAYLRQAQATEAQALALSDPVERRIAWERVLLNVDIAESHRQTSETIMLRQEAEAHLDQLLGITRMQFNPAFSSNLGMEISRMAASELDLFLLDAKNGEALRAQSSNNGRGFQLDTAFTCKPGKYGNYEVGHLVDILVLPALNTINASLLGIDAMGNLLYCAPGQVAQAIPLPPPDTNWGHVTAFTLDGGNLYILDAASRAVWVYNGKDGAFIDRPYFFFGGQTPEKQDVIDLVVAGDELFMLHGDGRLSTCSYSRIASKPTRCQDPAPLINPFAAYQNIDLFASAHFTQILFTAPPDSSILLLDADTQGVLRFAPRSLELQNQFRPTTGAANPIPPGPVGAVAVGPNHVLYVASNGQVYFATNMP